MFSDGIGLPLQSIQCSGVRVKRIGAIFIKTGCPSWRQPHAWDAISNSSKYNILDITQLIQLYIHLSVKFLHKTATLIYTVNRPVVASYDILG